MKSNMEPSMLANTVLVPSTDSKHGSQDGTKHGNQHEKDQVRSQFELPGGDRNEATKKQAPTFPKFLAQSDTAASVASSDMTAALVATCISFLAKFCVASDSVSVPIIAAGSGSCNGASGGPPCPRSETGVLRFSSSHSEVQRV